jgi:hypothetical protein
MLFTLQAKANRRVKCARFARTTASELRSFAAFFYRLVRSSEKPMWQLTKALLICVGFVALGVYTLHEDAPVIVSWGTIIIFGGMTVLGLAAMLYHAVKGKPLFNTEYADASPDQVALRDGREYKVEVTDEHVVLKNKKNGDVKQLLWSELTDVYVIAIDGMPVGRMSFILHRGKEITEIPTDTDGNEVFLAKMQEMLLGFDNVGFIEAMGMLHGFKHVWTKT